MDKALQTQLANIEKRTGKSIDELTKLVKTSGLTKHGAIRDWLKQTLGIGHGDANTLVHVALQSAAATAGEPEADAEATGRIYDGPKVSLRPIHDAVMKEVSGFGAVRSLAEEDLPQPAAQETVRDGRSGDEHARRSRAQHERRQGTSRLEALPPGGMCQYRVKLTSADQVDKELIGWIRQAYDAAE